jgi:hypothetical protein
MSKKNRSTKSRIIRLAVSLAVAVVLATAIIPPVTKAFSSPNSSVWYTPYTTTTAKSSTSSTSAVAAGTGSLAGLNVYQDNNSGLAFTGTWRSTKSTKFSGGSAKYAYKAGTALTVTFQGTSLSWVGLTSNACGQALVTVDGGAVQVVDLYSASSIYQQVVYTTGVLTAGTHTLRIESSGKKNAASRNTQVYVDAIGVAGTLGAGSTTVTTVPATTTTTAPATTVTTVPQTTTTTVPRTTTTTAAPTTPVTTVTNYDLQAAINAATSGSTINLPAGTYKGPFSISGKANLTITGSVGAIVTATNADVLTIVNSSNITLDGFTLVGDYDMLGEKCVAINGLTGGTFRNLTIRDAGNSGIYSSGVFSNILITGLNITHCGDFGVSFQGGANGVTIENCTMSGFASAMYPGHGVYARGSNNVMVRNVEVSNVAHLSANGDGGIQIAECTNATVMDCYTHDNARYGFIVDGGVATFIRCRGTNNAATDFYECGCTQSSSYTECTGTFSKYPN